MIDSAIKESSKTIIFSVYNFPLSFNSWKFDQYDDNILTYIFHKHFKSFDKDRLFACDTIKILFS